MPNNEPRKFYRTVFEGEILSDEPLPDQPSLAELHYLTTEGHCSGAYTRIEVAEVDGPTMSRLLQAQGSDPEFLDLDGEGNDLQCDD